VAVSPGHLIAQPATDEDILEAYHLWISNSPLESIFVPAVIKKNDTQALKYQLVLENSQDIEQVKRLIRVWNHVEQELSENGQDLPRAMLSQFARLKKLPYSQVEILLKTQWPEIFSGRIYYEGGKVRVEKEYMSFRDIDPVDRTVDVIIQDPYECFTASGRMEEVKKQVISGLRSFLETSTSTKDNTIKINVVQKPPYRWLISVSEIEGLITGRYQEKLEMEVSFHPNSENVEVCYELFARYSSGIIEQGEYKDVKEHYFKELISYNQKAKSTIRSILSP